MPVLLYFLRDVPPDEADAVRQLLDVHAIDFYETSVGNWGVSLPAIWLPDNTQFLTARRLLDEHQRQRFCIQQPLHEQDGLADESTNNYHAFPLRLWFDLLLLLMLMFTAMKFFPKFLYYFR